MNKKNKGNRSVTLFSILYTGFLKTAFCALVKAKKSDQIRANFTGSYIL